MCDEMDWKAEAMRFRAERDQARQEYERFEAQRDQARQELYRARQDLKNARVELCSALGIDPDTGWSDAMSEMGRRLMPEGMEWLLDVWPKWDDGEYCRFGDWWTAKSYGEDEPRKLLRLAIYTPEQLDEWGQGDGESYGYEWDFMRPSDTGYRPVKVEPPAPKVLDADGVEIRVGDTVWTTRDLDRFTVTNPNNGKFLSVSCEGEDGEDYRCYPTDLTHRAPVLAADGKPLREGETVYHVADGRACVAREVRENGAVVEPVDGRPCGRCRADYLTHERPVVDTWERLEDDAKNENAVVYCKERGIDCEDMAPVQAIRVDLVRRAKALAGVSG